MLNKIDLLFLLMILHQPANCLMTICIRNLHGVDVLLCKFKFSFKCHYFKAVLIMHWSIKLSVNWKAETPWSKNIDFTKNKSFKIKCVWYFRIFREIHRKRNSLQICSILASTRSEFWYHAKQVCWEKDKDDFKFIVWNTLSEHDLAFTLRIFFLLGN